MLNSKTKPEEEKEVTLKKELLQYIKKCILEQENCEKEIEQLTSLFKNKNLARCLDMFVTTEECINEMKMAEDLIDLSEFRPIVNGELEKMSEIVLRAIENDV